MRNYQYFVATKGNWAGETWKPIDGPFPTKREAIDRAAKFEYIYRQPTGGIDVKSQVQAAVFSKTRLIREVHWSEDRLWECLAEEARHQAGWPLAKEIDAIAGE